MARVSFGTKYIQKLKRVSLNHNLLDNLDVREGDAVDLYFDTKEKAIMIKKSRNRGASETQAKGSAKE